MGAGVANPTPLRVDCHVPQPNKTVHGPFAAFVSILQQPAQDDPDVTAQALPFGKTQLDYTPLR